MERQNQPSTSDDSFENYYLQEHYLEDIYIIPGSKDSTFKSQVNYVSNLRKSGGFEEDEVTSHAVNEYFRFLDKNFGSKRFKNRMEKSPRRYTKPSSLPSRAVSTRRRINLMDFIKQGNWKVTGKRGHERFSENVIKFSSLASRRIFTRRRTNLMDSVKQGNWKIAGKRSRGPTVFNIPCRCNAPSLQPASPKGSRLNCVVEEESEAANLLLGLKESIMQGRGDEDEELGGFLFKKRKIDETENQDSSDVDKIKPLDNNESDMKKSDKLVLLPNPNCSVGSVGSRPQNPTSPKKSDVKDTDHHDEQQSNLNCSEDIKQPSNPICSDDSESNMMAMDKKNTIQIVFVRRARKTIADSKRDEPKSSQESEKRGSDGSKEYKCSICGASFISFQALGGHKSSHTIRVRRERVGDDNQVKKKNKMEKLSSGSEEVASHGCNERCHGLNAGSHDLNPQSPSTVLVLDLNEPAPVQDSDFSSPVY